MYIEYKSNSSWEVVPHVVSYCVPRGGDRHMFDLYFMMLPANLATISGQFSSARSVQLLSGTVRVVRFLKKFLINDVSNS